MSRAYILDELVMPGVAISLNGVDLASISRIIQLLRRYDMEHITGRLPPLEALECLLEYRKNGLKQANELREEIDRLRQQNTRLIARLQKVSEAIDPSVKVQP